MIDRQKLDSQLMLDEGLRLKPYLDSLGKLTTGVGRNLDDNPLSPAELAVVGHNGRTATLTHDQAMFLLHNDEMKAINSLSNYWPWWSQLDDVRGRVMIDLVFNMGAERLRGFVHFMADMRDRNFKAAGYTLKDSLWYKEVGDRGPRLVNMTASGQDYTA